MTFYFDLLRLNTFWHRIHINNFWIVAVAVLWCVDVVVFQRGGLLTWIKMSQHWKLIHSLSIIICSLQASKMADKLRRGAPAATNLGRSWSKPWIYEAVDGKIIVEYELLNFLTIKIRTMSQDELVLLAVNNFDSEWIESSRKVLFQLCPDTKQRYVAFKGNQKDTNNIKSCLKVLNECGMSWVHLECFARWSACIVRFVRWGKLQHSRLRLERICGLLTVTIDRRVATMENHLLPGG